MSRLFDDGVPELAQVNSTPITAVPLTLACWFYSDSIALNQTLIGIYDASVANQWFTLQAMGAVIGDKLWAQVQGGIGGAQAATSSGYSANTWHHACGVFASATSRTVYIDGGSAGSDAANKTPSGLDRITVGYMGDSTPTYALSGRVAWASIWSAALSAVEIASLAGGILPWKVRAANLKACYPLWGLHSPELDISGNGYDLTLTGTTRADDPPVAPFSMRMRGQAPMRSWPYLHPRGARAGMMELVGGMH
jgi:hypothetical protein